MNHVFLHVDLCYLSNVGFDDYVCSRKMRIHSFEPTPDADEHPFRVRSPTLEGLERLAGIIVMHHPLPNGGQMDAIRPGGHPLARGQGVMPLGCSVTPTPNHLKHSEGLGAE